MADTDRELLEMAAKDNSAAEANAMKQLADPDWHVAQILESVRRAAKAGKCTLKSYICTFSGGRLYGGKPTDLQQSIIRKLEELGYSAEIRVDKSQFADIWLEVRWVDKQ